LASGNNNYTLDWKMLPLEHEDCEAPPPETPTPSFLVHGAEAFPA